jgi:hypothetical protein
MIGMHPVFGIAAAHASADAGVNDVPSRLMMFSQVATLLACARAKSPGAGTKSVQSLLQ